MPAKEQPDSSRWTELLFKVLSGLVVPILAWAIHLPVSLAVMNTEIIGLKESNVQLRDQYTQVSRQYDQLTSEVRSMGGTVREIQVTTSYVRETITEMRNEARGNNGTRQ